MAQLDSLAVEEEWRARGRRGDALYGQRQRQMSHLRMAGHREGTVWEASAPDALETGRDAVGGDYCGVSGVLLFKN